MIYLSIGKATSRKKRKSKADGPLGSQEGYAKKKKAIKNPKNNNSDDFAH